MLSRLHIHSSCLERSVDELWKVLNMFEYIPTYPSDCFYSSLVYLVYWHLVFFATKCLPNSNAPPLLGLVTPPRATSQSTSRH